MEKCECCGQDFIPRNFDDGAGNTLSDFCIDCKLNRCDAFPGTCPNRLYR